MKRLLCVLVAFALCAGALAAPKPTPEDVQKFYNDKNVSRMKGGSLVTVSILALLMLVLLCAAPLVL